MYDTPANNILTFIEKLEAILKAVKHDSIWIGYPAEHNGKGALNDS